MHVKMEVSRHEGGGPDAQNVDVTAGHNLVHHPVELVLPPMAEHLAQLVNVGLNDRRQHILIHIPRRLDALGGG